MKINYYRGYNCGRIFTISGPNWVCPLSIPCWVVAKCQRRRRAVHAHGCARGPAPARDPRLLPSSTHAPSSRPLSSSTRPFLPPPRLLLRLPLLPRVAAFCRSPRHGFGEPLRRRARRRQEGRYPRRQTLPGSWLPWSSCRADIVRCFRFTRQEWGRASHCTVVSYSMF